VWPFIFDEVILMGQQCGIVQLNMRDVNQLRNFYPWHFLFSCNLLSFLKVSPSAKSATIQMGKPGCIQALGGYPD
jgi:hypothetical protein